jgi:LytS/YehU family sensor histidine kinase
MYVHVLVFRDNIQENVDMIKLQREVKEKASKLQVVEAKYQSLNEVTNNCDPNRS